MEQDRDTRRTDRERMRQERLIAALNATAGVLSVDAHPEWATSEDVARWVREIRGHSGPRPGAY